MTGITLTPRFENEQAHKFPIKQCGRRFLLKFICRINTARIAHILPWHLINV